MPEPTPNDVERIQAARAEARRAIESDTLCLIHWLDINKLISLPTTLDAVIVNIDGRQYIVVDGIVYRVTSDVRNNTKLTDVMPKRATENADGPSLT